MRRPDGVTIIAFYQFIVSLPLLIMACAIAAVPISGALQNADDVGRFWALFGLGIGFLFVLGSALVGIVSGLGLLRLKGWARWLTVILAVLSLPLFPIGTLIGALIIWYLLQEHVRLAFETGGAAELVSSAPASPGKPDTEAGLPYVIGSEVAKADTAETLLGVDEVEEGLEETVADEAQTLVSESEAVVDEAEEEVETAAPETLILSEEELSEAQETAEDAAEDEETA